MVNGAPIQGDDFTWSSTLNLNYNKNEILALSDTNADVYLYDWVGGGSVLRVGESMGSFWGLERKGVYTLEDYKAGACEKTQIGRAKRSDEKTIIGKGLPDWTGSWINNFSYKNFDLTVDLQFVWGVETLQRFMCTTNDRFGITNGLKGVLYDAYDGTNPETMQPMIYLASGAHFGEEHAGQDITSDSGWVANGSYLRCNMVQLGYTFNSQLIKKIGLSGLRLYASGNNLFQIVSKDFLGYDPESSSETSGKFGQNMTFFSYPRARTFTLGVNVTFLVNLIKQIIEYEKILIIIIVCANMMSFSACDDFLKEEPKSQLTNVGYYTTEAQAVANVNYLYRTGAIRQIASAPSAYLGSFATVTGMLTGYFSNSYEGQEVVCKYSRELSRQKYTMQISGTVDGCGMRVIMR